MYPPAAAAAVVVAAVDVVRPGGPAAVEGGCEGGAPPTTAVRFSGSAGGARQYFKTSTLQSPPYPFHTKAAGHTIAARGMTPTAAGIILLRGTTPPCSNNSKWSISEGAGIHPPWAPPRPPPNIFGNMSGESWRYKSQSVATLISRSNNKSGKLVHHSNQEIISFCTS